MTNKLEYQYRTRYEIIALARYFFQIKALMKQSWMTLLENSAFPGMILIYTSDRRTICSKRFGLNSLTYFSFYESEN